MIPPGASASFSTSFDPSTTGTKTCDILIHSNDPASPHSYQLIGSGTAATIDVTPDPLSWGSVVVGATAHQTVTVTNAAGSTAGLTVNGLSLSGTHAAQFGIVSPVVPPEILLAPGETQAVTVSCTPTSAGAKTATLSVASDADVVADASVTLSCDGVVPDLALTPPTTTAFGDRQIGTTSAMTTMTVAAAANAYTSPLWVSVVEHSGDLFEFGLSSDVAACATAGGCMLGPGQIATISISFSPTEIGAKGEVVRITTSDPDSGEALIDYVFSGSGIDPEISSSASTYDFGDVPVGSSANRTIVVESSGTTALSISSVALTGDDAGDFAIVSGPTGTSSIAPGASASFSVRCSPSAEAVRATTLRVTSNDHDEPIFDIALSCNGVVLAPSVTPNPIVFAPTYDCASSEELFVILENQGATSLSISGISSGSSTFSITTPPATCPVVLEPAGTATVGSPSPRHLPGATPPT